MLMAKDISYKNSSSFSPSDYLYGSHGKNSDPVFDNFRVIDLGIDLAIGSDCGKVDFKSTLKHTFKNVLDAKYFENMGKDIIAASPMLLTCYFSPTWCAILKHGQTKAHFLSDMRLDQCALIDKYTDKRSEDFYQERQGCVRRKIKQNGGDLESAMESCQNHWDMDLASWSGDSNGKVTENRLLESSAKWAGFEGKKAKKTLSLLKSFVGDTVISKGNISVDFGEKKIPTTPRTHLLSLERLVKTKLCDELVQKLSGETGRLNLERKISNKQIAAVTGDEQSVVLDRQTIRSLLYLPYRQRAAACKKLSDAIAMSRFSEDMNNSLDVLTTSLQNPHLPDNRRLELERKRKALKDQVEVTISLQKQKNIPLNQALYLINSQGKKYQSKATQEVLDLDNAHNNNRQNHESLFDCADGIMCR